MNPTYKKIFLQTTQSVAKTQVCPLQTDLFKKNSFTPWKMFNENTMNLKQTAHSKRIGFELHLLSLGWRDLKFVNDSNTVEKTPTSNSFLVWNQSLVQGFHAQHANVCRVHKSIHQ